MPYTITVLNDSPQALAYVKEAEALDFVKVTKTKETKKKTTTKAKATPAPELLEEDENGIPLKYKEEILVLSQKTKKAATKRFYAKRAEKSIS